MVFEPESLDEEIIPCPRCWNVDNNTFLGSLGMKPWFRCRSCGITFAGPMQQSPDRRA